MKRDRRAALRLAELQRLQQHLLGDVAQHAGDVAAVQADRDVLEGEHRPLHVLGQRRLLRLRDSRGSPRAPRSRCCSSARRSGRPGGASTRLRCSTDRKSRSIAPWIAGGDRRVELRHPRQPQDDRLGEAAVEPLEHAGRHLGAHLATGRRPRSAGARPAGSWRASAPACRSAAPRPSEPRCAGGRRAAAATSSSSSSTAESSLRAAFEPPEISGPVVRSSRNSTITASSTSWLILPRPPIARAKRCHVGLGEVAQEARGELGPDRGQDHRRLLDRARHRSRRQPRMRRAGAPAAGFAGRSQVGRGAHCV